MKNEIERRCLPRSELRIDGNAKPKITGYASVFNQWADIGGVFRERVSPGAFKKTLLEGDIRALWNHDPNYVLGRNKAGTLRMHEDSKGLAVEIDPIDTAWASDLMKSVARKDVSGMSFGFQVVKQDISHERSERTLTEVQLFDVSVCTFPAYNETTAQVRSQFQRAAAGDEKWQELDRIMAKIKAGIDFTEDDYRAMQVYLPTLQMPANADANHWRKLWIQAETLIGGGSWQSH
jgi:HK97 family phage prohead protease